MSNQLWSWILTIVGVTGFILAGRKIWWAWYINIACQGLWFTYAIVTKQYGFIVASIIYVIVFTQNAVRWTKEHNNVSTNFISNPDFEIVKRFKDETYHLPDLQPKGKHRKDAEKVVVYYPDDPPTW